MIFESETNYGFFTYFLTSIGIFLLSAFIFAAIYNFLKYKHIIKVTNNIPSAPTWPLIGHAHYFIGVPAHMMLKRVWNMAESLSGHDIKCMKVWLGPELNMIMSDLKDIEVVLGGTIHLEKAGEYKYLKPWLKEGLLISRGRKWHKRRKMITGSFHFQMLPQFMDIIENQSRILIEKWFNAIGDLDWRCGIDLYKFITLCTMDVICGKYIFNFVQFLKSCSFLR